MKKASNQKKASNKKDVNERYYSVFPTRLRNLMEKRKVTQQGLADVIGGTRQVVSQYRNGDVVPNMDKIIKIADFFNVSCDYLVGRTDVETTDITIKEISKITGLNENAIKSLKSLKRMADDFGIISILDTINMLLNENNFENGILSSIDSYLNMKIDNVELKLTTRGTFVDDIHIITADSLINVFLMNIQELLMECRKNVQNKKGAIKND